MTYVIFKPSPKREIEPFMLVAFVFSEILVTQNNAYNLIHTILCVCEGVFVTFGFMRRSKYEELQRERDKINKEVKGLTQEIGALRKEVQRLTEDREKSRRRIRTLEKQASNLRAQNVELADSVEILTKEREVLRKTIQRLERATRKTRGKRTRPLT